MLFLLSSNLCWPYWGCWKENWFRMQSSFVPAGFKAFGSQEHLQWLQLLKAQIIPGLKLHMHTLMSRCSQCPLWITWVHPQSKLLQDSIVFECLFWNKCSNLKRFGRIEVMQTTKSFSCSQRIFLSYRTCGIWCKNITYVYEYLMFIYVCLHHICVSISCVSEQH